MESIALIETFRVGFGNPYRRKPNNAIVRANATKNALIRRGTHQREESSTSMVGWAALAQPRTPCGYATPKPQPLQGRLVREETPTSAVKLATRRMLQRLFLAQPNLRVS